jgi:hypothetical protein
VPETTEMNNGLAQVQPVKGGTKKMPSQAKAYISLIIVSGTLLVLLPPGPGPRRTSASSSSTWDSSR